jgi:hypothetical protein
LAVIGFINLDSPGTAAHEDPLPEHYFRIETHDDLNLVEAMLLEKEQAKKDLVNKEKLCVNIFINISLKDNQTFY